MVAAVALGVFSYWEHLVITQHTGHTKKANNISWLDFFAKGKDLGFSNLEIKLLYELAKKSNMEHPAALFWSHVQMDGCIRYIVEKLRIAGTFHEEENMLFLDRLFEFRKKMEMEKPRWKRGLKKTTEINEMQRFQLAAGRYGIFHAKLLKNTSQEMLIERPQGNELPLGVAWKNMRLQVYFWRKDDAAYFFETVVADEIFAGDFPTLKLLHNDKVERTQNRNSVRIGMNKNARMYVIEQDGHSRKTAEGGGINCRMRDLSDTGCSVLVGGEAKTHFRLIMQFSIENTVVSIAGVVTAIEYNEDENTSILHIEADIIPLEIRNIIRCVVFGIIDDIDAAVYETPPPEEPAAGAAPEEPAADSAPAEAAKPEAALSAVDSLLAGIPAP
ncbi:MAG: PilZ domain-containing protein [Spirochaetaceae bacterium]|nr:PilZ domain-containing protein [Spirochaetaceae bacterium]